MTDPSLIQAVAFGVAFDGCDECVTSTMRDVAEQLVTSTGAGRRSGVTWTLISASDGRSVVDTLIASAAENHPGLNHRADDPTWDALRSALAKSPDGVLVVGRVDVDRISAAAALS